MMLPDHFVRNPGATEMAIATAQAALGGALPADYLDFMRISNGGESGDGPDLILWPIEDVPRWNKEHLQHTPFEGTNEIVLFGSNGGGEAFGFDCAAQGAIVEAPMIGMERQYLLHCADTFSGFLKNPTGFKE